MRPVFVTPVVLTPPPLVQRALPASTAMRRVHETVTQAVLYSPRAGAAARGAGPTRENTA